MEIDKFKKTWAQQKNETGSITPEKVKEVIKNNLNTYTASIRRRFWGEIIAAAFIYSAILIYVYAVKTDFNEFIFILIVISAILLIPAIFKFIRSISFFNKLDYSLDIKHALEKSLGYFKSTLKFCLRSVYVLSIAAFIMISFNVSNLNGGSWAAAGIVVYVVVVGLLTKPYINRLYGRQVKEIEKILDEME